MIGNNKIRDRILSLITTRFDKIPNTGHIQIWLQRVTLKIDRQKPYSERLCSKLNDPTIEIWNSAWLNNDLKALISLEPIIDEQVINNIDKVIKPEEVELFPSKNQYDY